MERDFNSVIAGALVGLSCYVYELNWELILIWFILMTIDVLYGVGSAAKRGEYKSGIMKLGLLNKIGEMFLLITTVLAQRVAIISGINVPVSSFFLGAFCFKELSSIFETYIEAGHTLPAGLEKWFKVAKENWTNEEDEEI